MIDRIRGDWQRLLASRSGFRFRERYRRRKRTVRGGFDLRKVFYVVVGMVITLASLLLAPLPGPGWGTMLVGLMILAGEFYVVARYLDRAEVALKRPARRARGLWARWPARVRMFVGLTASISGVALGLWALSPVLGWLS